jgi:hypothetical protein
MYDSEDFFELLNSHDQEKTLDNLVEIWKQNSHEAEEPEARHKERTMMVSKLNGFTKPGIKVFQNTDSNK